LTIREDRNIIRKGDVMTEYAQGSYTVHDITPHRTDGRRLVKADVVFDTAKRTLGECRVCKGEVKAE
jgi:hypothetical protein